MIDHFNEVFQNAMANSPNQSIDEHIDNFVSSPNLIQTFLKHVHCIGTVWSNKKNMPTFSPVKKLKRGDCKFETCKNVICVKWMDNWAVTLIGSNVGIETKFHKFCVVRKDLLANQKCHVQWFKINTIKVWKGLIFAINTLQHIILTDDRNFVFTCGYLLIWW